MNYTTNFKLSTNPLDFIAFYYDKLSPSKKTNTGGLPHGQAFFDKLRKIDPALVPGEQPKTDNIIAERQREPVSAAPGVTESCARLTPQNSRFTRMRNRESTPQTHEDSGPRLCARLTPQNSRLPRKALKTPSQSGISPSQKATAPDDVLRAGVQSFFCSGHPILSSGHSTLFVSIRSGDLFRIPPADNMPRRGFLSKCA